MTRRTTRQRGHDGRRASPRCRPSASRSAPRGMAAAQTASGPSSSSCRWRRHPASTRSRAPRSRRWRRRWGTGDHREPAGRRRHRRHGGTRQLAPDGMTLSIVSNNHVIYPSVYKSMPFDPIADITPIAVIGVDADRARRQSKGSGEEHAGTDRAAEGEARQAQLWIVGQRNDPAPRRRDVHRPGGRHGEAHPLQGRGADADRLDRRAGRNWRAVAAVGAAAHQERRAASASAWAHRRASPPRPKFRRWSSRECRATSSRAGSRSSARRRCRPPT